MRCFTFYFKMIDIPFLFFIFPVSLIRTVKSGVTKYSRMRFVISSVRRSESPSLSSRDLTQHPLRLQPSSGQEHRCSCCSTHKTSKKELPPSHDGQRPSRKRPRRACCNPLGSKSGRAPGSLGQSQPLRTQSPRQPPGRSLWGDPAVWWLS